MPKCVFSLAFRVLGGCFKCHKKEHQCLTSGFNIPADVDLQMHLSVTIAIDQFLYQYPKNLYSISRHTVPTKLLLIHLMKFFQ